MSERNSAYPLLPFAVFLRNLKGRIWDPHWFRNVCLHLLWRCLLNAGPEALFTYNYAHLIKFNPKIKNERCFQPSATEIGFYFCLSLDKFDFDVYLGVFTHGKLR